MNDQPQNQNSIMLSIMLAAVEVLLSKGVKQVAAVRIGKEISETLCRNCGGTNAYIPNNYVSKTSELAAEIYNEFDGHNYKYLAMRYGLSDRYLYKILGGTDKAQKYKNRKRETKAHHLTTDDAALLLKSRLSTKEK